MRWKAKAGGMSRDVAMSFLVSGRSDRRGATVYYCSLTFTEFIRGVER
jgi:hypothetical protein